MEQLHVPGQEVGRRGDPGHGWGHVSLEEAEGTQPRRRWGFTASIAIHFLGLVPFCWWVDLPGLFPTLSGSLCSLISVSFQELIEKFQLQSQSITLSLPLAELPSHMDLLQISHQTIEGALRQHNAAEFPSKCCVWSISVLLKKETGDFWTVLPLQLPHSSSVSCKLFIFLGFLFKCLCSFAKLLLKSRKKCPSLESAKEPTLSLFLRSNDPSCEQTSTCWCLSGNNLQIKHFKQPTLKQRQETYAHDGHLCICLADKKINWGNLLSHKKASAHCT